MRNAKKILALAEVFLCLGSAVYLFELLTREQYSLTTPVYILYGIWVILGVIGLIGTRDERREEKAHLKADAGE